MFEELIWHGEDIVRRLDAERALSASETHSYPDEERVLIGEAEAWREEVERRIQEVMGDYALSRYHLTREQLRKEIEESKDSELDRWARWHRRVVSYLKELQQRYDNKQIPSSRSGSPPAPGDVPAVDVVGQLSDSGRGTEYDVALSFAGEDRDVVERLAQLLRAGGVRVFYDKYEQASLWGKDLYQYLSNVYQDKARYCVIFLSMSYQEKLWTRHELRSAQARAFKENREYILPVRLDDSEIPAILGTTGYIDIRSTKLEDLADLLRAKLNESTNS
jgi:hypothetical protein